MLKRYRLLKNQTLAEIKIGDIVTDKFGENYHLLGYHPPRQPNSEGLVLVATLRQGHNVELFPTVIDAHIATETVAQQTFIVTLRNSLREPLDSFTLTVTHEDELAKAFAEFVLNIGLFRDGDTITIAETPWSEHHPL